MTPCVRFKDGVILGDPPSPAQVRILAALDRAARIYERAIWVTCGREAHGPADPHTRRRALDVRTKDFTAAEIVLVHTLIRADLGPDFFLQYETNVRPTTGPLQAIAVVSAAATAPHFHIQVKRTIAAWPEP